MKRITKDKFYLSEWQFEFLKKHFGQKFLDIQGDFFIVENMMDRLEDRWIDPRKPPFKWEPIIDEWTKNWEKKPQMLELTPEKLAEIRTDVLNALERNTLHYYRYDDFGNLTDELVTPYVPPSNPLFADEDEE